MTPNEFCQNKVPEEFRMEFKTAFLKFSNEGNVGYTCSFYSMDVYEMLLDQVIEDAA